MNKRKIIAIILCLCMILGFNSKAYAVENINGEESSLQELSLEDNSSEVTEDISSQSKAEVLNKLNIISGDGKGNFNLDSQLKRSEAAAFIVKLLGMDSYIKDNKDKHKSTGFNDVKSTDWFIPYISYCEQNSIISGLGNGKFGPNEYISEKAFLVLVMKCLGYSSEAGDFSWETVFSDAYRLGLVTDAEYEQRTEDNKGYLREDVVNVIYEALSLNSKNNNLSLLQRLVNDGCIDRASAFSTGLLNDTIITAISTVTPQSDSRISITLSEEVTPISLENIKIYESDRKSKILPLIKIVSQNSDKLIITTNKQIADKEYTLEILNITDLQGNVDKKISTTFKGYKINEIKSDFFKISKVINTSQNEINIYFTHPVNENVEVPAYYQIYENNKLFIEGKASTLKVDVLAGEENAVSLMLYNAVLNPDNEYKVKVSGSLISVYGTNLNNGPGDEASFIPLDLSNDEFIVKSIQATSNNTVQLNFNKEVNPVLAKQVYNYNITDSFNNPIQIKQASVIGADNKCISLTISGVLNKKSVYNVMINRLTDIDKKYEIVEKMYNFSGDYPDNIELSISNVTISDLETITIYFNKDVDEESALKKDNYTIVQVGGEYKRLAPDNIYFSKRNPDRVKLYFKVNNSLKNLANYKVRISPLFEDYTGASINRLLECDIMPNINSSSLLLISKAVVISPDTIMVKFTGKDISTDYPNSNAQNYSLEHSVNGEIYKKIPIAITYINTQTVVLKFDTLDLTQVYTLKCNEIKSYAGDMIKTDELKSAVSFGQ